MSSDLITIKRALISLSDKSNITLIVDIIIKYNIEVLSTGGTAKLLREKSIVNRVAKRILLRYFKSLDSKSARELLEDTDCIIEITPKEFSNWEY